MTRQTVLLSALGAVLVIALWWLFLYTPGQEDLARIQDEIAVAETEQVSLEQRLAELEAVRSRAPETEAAIAQLESVVPTDPALPPALRQIAAAADDAGMSVDALAATRPAVVDEPTGLHSATLSLTATGSYFQLVDFLRRLEDPEITARGITFNSLAVTPAEYPTLTVSLTGEMYAVLEPPPTPAAEAEPAPADAATEEAATGEEAAEEDES